MNQDNLTADHDLLIRLDQKVENLTKAIEDLTNQTIKRLLAVENEKAGRDELKNEKEARLKADEDIEKRMRFVERFIYTTLGISLIVQLVVMPIIIKFIIH